jgi:hypothetical protein
MVYGGRIGPTVSLTVPLTVPTAPAVVSATVEVAVVAVLAAVPTAVAAAPVAVSTTVGGVLGGAGSSPPLVVGVLPVSEVVVEVPGEVGAEAAVCCGADGPCSLGPEASVGPAGSLELVVVVDPSVLGPPPTPTLGAPFAVGEPL